MCSQLQLKLHCWFFSSITVREKNEVMGRTCAFIFYVGSAGKAELHCRFFSSITVSDKYDGMANTCAFICCVGSAGKGDQGMQNPGGQMDKPVGFHFLERSVQMF